MLERVARTGVEDLLEFLVMVLLEVLRALLRYIEELLEVRVALVAREELLEFLLNRLVLTPTLFLL